MKSIEEVCGMSVKELKKYKIDLDSKHFDEELASFRSIEAYRKTGNLGFMKLSFEFQMPWGEYEPCYTKPRIREALAQAAHHIENKGTKEQLKEFFRYVRDDLRELGHNEIDEVLEEDFPGIELD
ncbi:hypothetical protein FJZ53_01860 [Candidatus Woesearchaeota archaeon]|nr:hypothetical protein [Candidatus Woesearchaeota archaeon]